MSAPELLPIGVFKGQALNRLETPRFVVTQNKIDANRVIGRHAHKHDHLTFVLDGAYRENFGIHELDCVASSLIWVPKQEEHTDLPAASGAKTISIELRDEGLFAGHPVRGFFETPHQLIHPRLHTLAGELTKELHQPDFASMLTVESLALEAMAFCLRSDSPTEHQIPKWLRDVREYLHAHLGEAASLSGLAAQFGVDPSHLAKSFKSWTGSTIGDYARRLRIEKAVERLRRTDDPISTIAYDLGFSDTAHFTRTFTHVMGVTPSRYRRH